MIGTQIKVGKDYAVNTNARKGIKDLYALSAIKVRVLAKGHRRIHESNYEISYTGILVVMGGEQKTLKARDFLMPWPEYEAENKRRDREADEEEAQRLQAVRALQKRQDRVVAYLKGYDLNAADFAPRSVDYWASPESGGVTLTISGVEKLMNALTDKIYEALRDA